MARRFESRWSSDEAEPVDRPRAGRERIDYWIARILTSVAVGVFAGMAVIAYGRRWASLTIGWDRLYQVSIIVGAIIALLLIVFGFGRRYKYDS